ncbi:MAG: P-loop NTPase [Calditrichia bacterium]
MIRKDQASSLRLLTGSRQRKADSHPNHFPQQMMLVVSGKGGVGKSFFSLHLAQALSARQERVLLVDSNLMSPNLHVLTNKDPRYPLHHFLQHGRPFGKEALVPLQENLDLLGNHAAGSSEPHIANAPYFVELLQPLATRYDYVVMDTQTGLNEWNLSLLQYADLSLLMSITDPTSVIDTYTFIKASLPYLATPRFQLVVNQVIGESSGLEAHNNLNAALSHFLNYRVDLLGMLPLDMEIKRSAVEQKPLWDVSRNSPVIRTIQEMAKTVRNLLLKKKSCYNTQYQEANV